MLLADEWDGQGATHYAIVNTPMNKPGENFSKYATAMDSNNSFQPVPWRGFKTFKFAVTNENMRRAINDIRNACTSCSWRNFSDDPAKYKLIHINLNPEVAYQGAHAMIAMSFRNLSVRLVLTAAAPLLRFWNKQTGAHYYTTSPAKAASMQHPWVYEGVNGRLFEKADHAANLKPLYVLYNSSNQDYFYTDSPGEAKLSRKYGYQDFEGGIAGYIPSGNCSTGQYLYRTFIPSQGKHFYTSNVAEVNVVKSYGTNHEATYCLPPSR